MAAPRKPSLNVRNKAVLLLLVIIPDRREQEPQPNQSQEMHARHFRSEELRISRKLEAQSIEKIALLPCRQYENEISRVKNATVEY